jgi:hypothetical protein
VRRNTHRQSPFGRHSRDKTRETRRLRLRRRPRASRWKIFPLIAQNLNLDRLVPSRRLSKRLHAPNERLSTRFIHVEDVSREKDAIDGVRFRVREDLFKREKGVIFTYRVAFVRAEVRVRGDEDAKRVRVRRFHETRARIDRTTRVGE